jgi:hypothetical protein
MYIPLSFFGGSGAAPSCSCKYITFTGGVGGGTVNYNPCNTEVIQQLTLTSGSTSSACVADWTNMSKVGDINWDPAFDYALYPYCVSSTCQTAACWNFYFMSTAANTVISYIPCNVTASYTQSFTLGLYETASMCLSFPEEVRVITGSLETFSGVVGPCTTGSLAYPSGTVFVGEGVSGGRIGYVTGTYPNQSGLIITSQSVATGTDGRFGFYGTQTNIRNRTYGGGAANTNALQAYTPATASMVANTVGSASYGGKTDWYVPSSGDMTTAFGASGGGYYNTIVPFSQRNQSFLGTFHLSLDGGRNVPTRWFLGAYIYPFTYPAPFVNANIQTSVEADPGVPISARTENIVMDLDLNLTVFNKNSTPNQVIGIRYFNNNSEI